MTELVWEDHGDFALIRFEGAEQLNAFSSETYLSLHRELGTFAREERWRALIITGAGRAFCSGQNLKEEHDAGALSRSDLRGRLELLQGLTRRMRALPKVLIAAINGPAVGFGAELTLACDVRFASADAYFMFPELAHGLYFTNATLELLPAFAGSAQALDLLLSGRRWSAADALAAGFVSRMLPSADLLPEAKRFAAQVASSPVGAIASTLTFIRARHGTSVDSALTYEVETLLALSAAAQVADTTPQRAKP
jgi:enoyl-CoA hydratase/carnithine racemase